MSNKYSVSIIIPNWNGSELLSKHLPAITAARGISEVIVVDDASTDDSVELLHRQFPKVRVIKKDRHEGFASTVNSGVSAAHGDVVVLLNTDAVPQKEFLKPLVSHFSDPRVFAVGCLDKSVEDGRIVLRGRGEAAWTRGFFVHWRGEVDKKTTAWVSAGSGAFRKSIWEELGGMDEIFNPFYWEDIDLSYRALKAGYRLVFEPKSIVMHYHEKGKIKREYSPREIKRISYRNQFIFIWKNLTDIFLLVEHVCWAPIRMLSELMKGDTYMILGFISALAVFPKIFVSRRRASQSGKLSDRDIAT